MNWMKDDHNESCSSNHLFSGENHFQENYWSILPRKLTLNFENALFLTAQWKILATVWEKINI